MGERHRKKIEELMGEVQCTKGFSCVQSEFKELCKIADLDWDELCKVTDLGWEDYVCLEESPPECSLVGDDRWVDQADLTVLPAWTASTSKRRRDNSSGASDRDPIGSKYRCNRQSWKGGSACN